MEKPVHSPPEWFDNELLEKALRTYKKDETIEIISFETRASFSEHFGSSMFQSSIKFKSSKYPKADHETLGVVVKSKPVDDAMKMNLIAGGPLFENEVAMYTKTIPAMQQLFERSGMKIELAPE